MENHHFYGKIHYKWPFSIVILPLPEGTCFHFPGILMFRVITRILIQSTWDSPSIPSPQRQGSDVPPRFWEPGATPVQGRIFSDSRVAVSWLKGPHWKWHGFFGSSKYIEHDRTEQYIFVIYLYMVPLFVLRFYRLLQRPSCILVDRFEMVWADLTPTWDDSDKN